MRRPMLVVPGSLCLLCSIGAGASAQQATTRAERVQVQRVQIPLRITVDGKPLRGLTAADLELLVAGKPHPIASLDELGVAALGGDSTAGRDARVPFVARRHFLLLFDLSFSRTSSLARARQDVLEWAASSLHPSDLTAVATFSLDTGTRLLLNFTSDREQLVSSILTFGNPEYIESAADPLRLAIGRPKNSFAAYAQLPGLLDGSQPIIEEDRMTAALQEIYYGAMEPTENQRRRNDASVFARSFENLAELLRAARGSKHLVYFSEGFDSALVVGSSDPQEVQRMNASVETGALWRVDPGQRFGSGVVQVGLESMLEAFRSADCSIHAVDIGALAEGGRTLPGHSDSLYLLADGTGGEVYRNFESLNRALDQLLESTSVVYVLSFEPKTHGRKDTTYKVKVRLREQRKQARIVHRSSYRDEPDYADQAVEQRLLRASQLVVEGGAGGAIESAVLAAPFPLDDLAVLPILIEIPVATLAGARREGLLSVEIFAYAFDGLGRIADSLAQTVMVDVGKADANQLRKGLKFFGDLRLRPGRYSLRVLVQDGGSGAYGLKSSDVYVPDYAAGEAFVLPPLIPEPRGQWLLTREIVPDEAQRPPFPYVLAGEPYLPAARPGLSEQPVRLLVVAYNLGAEPWVFEGSLRDAAGREIRRFPLSCELTEPAAERGKVALVTDFDVSDLAPGSYALEVEVETAAGGRLRSAPVPLVKAR